MITKIFSLKFNKDFPFYQCDYLRILYLLNREQLYAKLIFASGATYYFISKITNDAF